MQHKIALAHKLVANIEYKGKPLAVWRNEHGKFYVIFDNKQTQHNLTAEGIVRYLCHAMNSLFL